ncbi:hypothetical protein A8C56_11115 [Niabella ginsenosidivorans]|uniref:ABC transporter permease n=1 Tax=Niabella ginsenosidivorans TaxID=1176587 RepID=A0A1A9I1F6_9BACT|nr:ABC transporter permease [Niabella ginsenosidivorans]ANH81456.1 hypothetical protein A8C56_11115 [Niabella ginsenosidivorans]
MLKNYIKIAWRNIVKRKSLAVINLLCLSIGFCFALVIGVYITQQKSINQQFRNIAHQYILRSNRKPEDMGTSITNPAPFSKALKEEYPNLVKNYYRYNPVTNVVSAGDQSFRENIAIGDTNFVSMYGLPVLYGNPERAFDNVNAAVVTASFAKKMFGTENAIGKTIAVQTVVEHVKQDYTISAVIKDLPYNSVFNQGYFEGYTVFVPGIGNKYYGFGDPLTGWTNNSCVAMVELQDGVLPKDLIGPSKQLLAKYTPDFFQKNLTVEYAAVKDFYLHDNDNAVERMITILSIISIFILMMAIFNFVNISTAAATYRVREIGLRKVFGSKRVQIALQFLMEAWLLALAGGVLALFLYETTRPWFSGVLGTEMISVWHFRVQQYAGFVLMVAAIGFLAGAYPAFSVARSGTAISVKGKPQTANSGLLFRRIVLIVQFSMAILVFIGAAIVNKQVHFIFNRDTGYNKDQLMVLTAFPKQWDSVGVQKMDAIKQGLLQLPEVTSATLSFDLPDRTQGAMNLLPVNESARPIVVPSFVGDEDYGQTFRLRMKEGNFLNHKKNFVPGQIVINETAARLLGLDNGAVGKQLRTPEGAVYTVTGVVKDYNAATLREAIKPLAICHVKDAPGYRYLTLKLKYATAGAVARIKQEWQKLSPGNPFEYSFMDDKFAALYKSELQLKKAATTATVLSLIIVFLGVFGVVSIMLMKRDKEIAVRKVLGAGLAHIFALFITEYSWLILIANLISWPLAYYFISQWLKSYAYYTEQGISAYVSVAFIIFGLVCLLVAGRTFKTALENPVKSLRNE